MSLAKKEKKNDFIDTNESFYVVVSEFDESNQEERSEDPIVHETRYSCSSLEDAKNIQAQLKDSFGRTKIASLVFFESDENDESDKNNKFKKYSKNMMLLNDDYGDCISFSLDEKGLFIDLMGSGLENFSYDMTTVKKLRDFLNERIKG